MIISLSQAPLTDLSGSVVNCATKPQKTVKKNIQKKVNEFLVGKKRLQDQQGLKYMERENGKFDSTGTANVEHGENYICHLAVLTM